MSRNWDRTSSIRWFLEIFSSTNFLLNSAWSLWWRILYNWELESQISNLIISEHFFLLLLIVTCNHLFLLMKHYNCSIIYLFFYISYILLMFPSQSGQLYGTRWDYSLVVAGYERGKLNIIYHSLLLLFLFLVPSITPHFLPPSIHGIESEYQCHRSHIHQFTSCKVN